MSMEKPSKKTRRKRRRSGVDRRTTFITPYLDFIYNGSEKRYKKDRRTGEDRRKESDEPSE